MTNGRGTWLVAWQSNYNLTASIDTSEYFYYYSISKDNGKNWSIMEQLDFPQPRLNWIKVAVSIEANVAVVVFCNVTFVKNTDPDPEAADVSYKKYDFASQNWTDAKLLSRSVMSQRSFATSMALPEITFLFDGTFLATFVDLSFTTVSYSISFDNGTTFSSTPPVLFNYSAAALNLASGSSDPNNTIEILFPKVIGNGNMDAIVVWRQTNLTTLLASVYYAYLNLTEAKATNKYSINITKLNDLAGNYNEVGLPVVGIDTNHSFLVAYATSLSSTSRFSYHFS